MNVIIFGPVHLNCANLRLFRNASCAEDAAACHHSDCIAALFHRKYSHKLSFDLTLPLCAYFAKLASFFPFGLSHTWFMKPPRFKSPFTLAQIEKEYGLAHAINALLPASDTSIMPTFYIIYYNRITRISPEKVYALRRGGVYHGFVTW